MRDTYNFGNKALASPTVSSYGNATPTVNLCPEGATLRYLLYISSVFYEFFGHNEQLLTAWNNM